MISPGLHGKEGDFQALESAPDMTCSKALGTVLSLSLDCEPLREGLGLCHPQDPPLQVLGKHPVKVERVGCSGQSLVCSSERKPQSGRVLVWLCRARCRGRDRKAASPLGVWRPLPSQVAGPTGRAAVLNASPLVRSCRRTRP